MDVLDSLAVIGAGFAIIVSVMSWRSSAQSAQAAKVSAEEAVRSADAGERSAAAAEKANELALDQATKYVPPWAIRWIKGDVFGLVNKGGEPAFEVSLKVDPPLERGVPAGGSWEQIGPREVRDFRVFPIGATGRSVVVTWRRPSETSSREWRAPYPRKQG